MKGFYIRLFASNTAKNEVNGLVAQSEFQPSEILTIWASNVKLYQQGEGEVLATPAGRLISNLEYRLGFNIVTRAVDFWDFAQIEALELFLKNKQYIYLATRWQGQGTEGRYPRAIPSDETKAIRIAVKKLETTNDDGLLRLEISGWVAKW